MKNILPDLQERFEVASNRKSNLLEQVKLVDAEMESLKTLVAIEKRRLAEAASRSIMTSPTAEIGSTNAADYIEGILQNQTRSKEAIRKKCVGRGLFDEDSAGRQVHITLLNMEKNKRVVKLPDGRYTAPGNESPRPDDPAGASSTTVGGVAERPIAPDS